jgi:hypothetical protein
MTNVVKITSGEEVREAGTPNPVLIAVIKGMLEMAESGKLQCLIGVGFTAERLRASFVVDHHENVYEMLGSLAWMHAEYIHNHTADLG